MLVDLHVHSDVSDGTLSPTEIVIHAKEKGLSAISLTDHDTVKGLDEAIEAGKIYKVEVIPGIELSADFPNDNLHILGYCINHKDENRTNNNVDNLEWCSYSYNNSYGNARGKFSKSYSRNHSRAVEMLSLSGEKIREFSSVKNAAIFVGGTSTSIDRGIAKITKIVNGYILNLI